MEIKVRINGKHMAAPLESLVKLAGVVGTIKDNHPDTHVSIEMVIEPKGDYGDSKA